MSALLCVSRTAAVRQMLCRHVTLKNSVESEKEHFVVNQLHVPVEWVHEAKVSFMCLFYSTVFCLICAIRNVVLLHVK